MKNILVATSKPINVDLESYEPGRASYSVYLIRDSYTFPSAKNGHGQYIIQLESPIIRDESDLSHHFRAIKEITRRITVLTKCVLGEALNTSPWETDVFTKRIERMGQLPLGWESNYEHVQDELDKKKGYSMSIDLGPHHYYTFSESPFLGFIKALKNYTRLRPIEKDLLQVMNDADLASFTSRYMLLSKALEMINAMYPLKGTDNRIQTLLPELVDKFDGMTLKDLMNLANNRKETRHYVDRSDDSLSHPAMSEDELKLFYSKSNQLCLNILRRSLGLGLVDFSAD